MRRYHKTKFIIPAIIQNALTICLGKEISVGQKLNQRVRYRDMLTKKEED